MNDVSTALVAAMVSIFCGDIVPLEGTLVSGVAYYDPGSDKTPPLVPAPRVLMYCAWGKYGEGNGEVYDCQDIWGKDCSSAGEVRRESTGEERREPKGLFHFHHSNSFENRHISLMHRLDDTNPCSDPGTAQGRYFSRFFTPTSKDKGKQVKAEFILHPTFKPFKIAEAARQIAEIVAVRYFMSRKLNREIDDEALRREIEKEVAIVLDSLREQDPREVMAQIKKSLEKVMLRDGERLIPVLSFFKDEEFWLRRDRSWDKEIERWSKIRPILERKLNR